MRYFVVEGAPVEPGKAIPVAARAVRPAVRNSMSFPKEVRAR